MVKLAALTAFLQPDYLYGEISDMEIVRLSDDSRTLYPQTIGNNIFVAIAGHKVNGLDYIDAAYNAGIRIFLVDSSQHKCGSLLADRLNDAVFIFVNGLNKRLPEITLRVYGDLSERFTRTIGVTGTNGKTTTTKILQYLYLKSGANVGLIGTINYQYGREGDIKVLKAPNTTPNIISLYNLLYDMLQNGADTLLMEVSSHALAEDRIHGLSYDTFIFTNLTQDHLDFHHNMDEYLDSKLKIVDYLKPNGTGIINTDDNAGEKFALRLRAAGKKALYYGLNATEGLQIQNYSLSAQGIGAELSFNGKKIDITSNLLGLFNLYNLAGAIGCALSLGYDEKALLEAIKNIPQVKGRMDTIRFTDNTGEKLIVVDYAHTPDGLEKILTNCREFTSGRLISVFGCGGDRDNTKRPIMGGLSARLADVSYITSDNPRTEPPRSILDQVEAGFIAQNTSNKEYHKIVDRYEAIREAVLSMNGGDTLVIAGKGHEDYQIFADRTIHFDDGEVALEIIGSLPGARVKN